MTSVAVGMAALLVGYGLGAAVTTRAQNQAQSAQQPLVNNALGLYGNGKVSRSDLLRTYKPVVVYLPDMTCVAMKRRKGLATGEDTMCFDKAEQRLLFTHAYGE